MTPWTVDEHKSLIELVALGWSSTKIAVEMSSRHGRDFTRNAIIGKIHRINALKSEQDRLKLRGVGGGQVGRSSRRKVKAEGDRKVSEPKLSVQEALTKFYTEGPREEGEPPPAENVDFFGVPLPPDDGQCHYIHGDPRAHSHLYCRQPALKLGPATFDTYCPYHAALLHRDARTLRTLSDMFET